MEQYYNGHKITISNGYPEIYLPEHHRARKSGNVHVHILVAEKLIGRSLLDDEVVHHIDGDRLNYDERNIMIFASQSDHASYHRLLENPNLNFVLYRLNNIYHCKANLDVFGLNECLIEVQQESRTVKMVKRKLCPVCGNPITYRANLCQACRHLKDRVVERPARNVLKQEIRQFSFVALSRKYGVTDNAIRKWCKSYNLPYKSSVIKSISSKDWRYV